MNIIIKNFLSVSLLSIGTFVQAQSYTATVQDASTGAPIPFATVQLSENSGTITNEEGVFAITAEQMAQLKDSVYVWSMGYEKIALFPKKVVDTVLTLKEKVNELDNLFLTDNPLEVEEIIDRIEENLAVNYPNTLREKKIFFRESQVNRIDKMDIKVEKTSIPEFNQAFIDSLVDRVPRKNEHYTESVGSLFGNYEKSKLFIEKAANLYDKSKDDVGVESFAKRLEEIVESNVKPDSYFKIKSGIFGAKIEGNDSTTAGGDKGGLKIEVDTDEDLKEEVKTKSVNYAIGALFDNLFFKEDSELDFLSKSNRYRFTKREFTTIGDAIVYVIDFEPKGKKDFKGTMYVNTDDYAVMRLEYSNVRDLRNISLLGISFKRYLYKGKSIYEKDDTGGYSLRYMEVESGSKTALDRPLKIIEKNKNVAGRRKQNEVAIELEIGNTEYSKSELVIFNATPITQSTFDSAIESEKLEATYLPAYDPKFWEGYAIIEPNTAIQTFKSSEEMP